MRYKLDGYWNRDEGRGRIPVYTPPAPIETPYVNFVSTVNSKYASADNFICILSEDSGSDDSTIQITHSENDSVDIKYEFITSGDKVGYNIELTHSDGVTKDYYPSIGTYADVAIEKDIVVTIYGVIHVDGTDVVEANYSFYNTTGKKIKVTIINDDTTLPSANVAYIEGDNIVRINNYVDRAEAIPARYVLATDSDFTTTPYYSRTYEKYTGTDDYVIIPNTIKGSTVTNAELMFQESSVLGVATYINSSIQDMNNMFKLHSGSSLELRWLSTARVTNMNGMFASCILDALDLSYFTTENVQSMTGIFLWAEIPYIDLGGFILSDITSIDFLFYGATIGDIDMTGLVCDSISADVSSMFYETDTSIIDLSWLRTDNVTANTMFTSTTATTGYARTQDDADFLNAVSGKPTGLVFEVKDWTG